MTPAEPPAAGRAAPPAAARPVVMVSTGARGGMRAVIDTYEDSGLHARWKVRVLHSHRDGNALRRALAGAQAFARLAGWLARREVGLVHLHAASGNSFWRKAAFAGLARAFGVPVVLHLHGAGMREFHAAQGPAGQARIRRQLERAECVVVLSESWRAFVRQIAPRAAAEAVANYVALPAPADCGRPHAGINVLFLGILGPRKGIYDLLPAFARARAQVPGLRLAVGGNGEVGRTREAVRALGLEDAVEVLGWVGGDAKRDLLAAADVFVLPSYNEGLPVGLLEAMSYGVPVISTRVGGIPELVREGIDGYLVEAGDQAALADRLARLAADADLRRAMGAAGRARIVAEFSAAAILPRLDAIYAQLLGAHAPAGARAAKRD